MRAVQGSSGVLNSWVAGVDLTLRLTDTVSQGQSGVTVFPAVTGGTMTVPIGGSGENKRVGARTVRYDVALTDLRSGTSAGGALAASCVTAKKSDGLGLENWLAQTASTAALNGAQLNALIFDVQFTASRSGSGGLTFKTTPISTIDVKIDGPKASNSRDNRLVITFRQDTSRADEPAGLTVIPADLREELQDSLDDISDPDDEGATIQLVPGQTIVIQ